MKRINLHLIGRQRILVIASGIVIGLLLAFAVGQLIQDFPVGVDAADAVTYITISVSLAAVALAACLVPARRAVAWTPWLHLGRNNAAGQKQVYWRWSPVHNDFHRAAMLLWDHVLSYLL
ncbi:MAG TPA: hypothetical protein VE133_12260 [Candidatus Sulfotelmatobacter sp.]|nr:hypothetical protein [Candidatus Sulfotelmatobacter sp.]